MAPKESHNNHKSDYETDPKQATNIGLRQSQARLDEVVRLGEQHLAKADQKVRFHYPRIRLGESLPMPRRTPSPRRAFPSSRRTLVRCLGEETSSITRKSSFSSPNRPLTKKNSIFPSQRWKVSQGRKNPLPLRA